MFGALTRCAPFKIRADCADAPLGSARGSRVGARAAITPMVFPTIQFAVFFPIVLALSWALMKRQQVWKPFTLAMSFLFYSAANWTFCIMLAGMILGNQGAAKLIHNTEDKRRRKLIVTLAVAADLATLGVFKYYGFFATEINATLDKAGL